MTTYEKNVSYNAQGEPIYQTATPASYMTTTYTTAPLQNVQSAGLVTNNPSLNEPGAKGKMLRFYNKIETSMRKKWDSSSGPSSRTDPLGGYTVKGPGYYEKKHKITRRVTSRGNPPPMQLSNGCQTVAAKNVWTSQDSYTIQDNTITPISQYSTTPISSQNYTPPPLPQRNISAGSTSSLTSTTPMYSTTPMNSQTTSSPTGPTNSSTPLSSQNYSTTTPPSSTPTTKNTAPLSAQNPSNPLTSQSSSSVNALNTPPSSQTIPQQNINVGSQNTYPSSTTPFSSSAAVHYSSPSAPATLPTGFPSSYTTPSVPTS